MLTAPVSYHRLLFGQRRKAELVWASSPLAVGGLVLMLGVAAAVLLIADVVLGRRPAVVLTARDGGLVRGVLVCRAVVEPPPRRDG